MNLSVPNILGGVVSGVLAWYVIDRFLKPKAATETGGTTETVTD